MGLNDKKYSRTQWMEDKLNNQRYIFIHPKWRKVTGRSDNRYYLYTVEYAKSAGIEPKQPYECNTGDWALTKDGKYCMQVLERRKTKAGIEYIVLGTRYYRIGGKYYNRNYLDDTVFFYRSKFGGKNPVPVSGTLSEKQKLFAKLCAINFMENGRMNYKEVAQKVYGKKMKGIHVRKLIESPKIQKEIFMNLKDFMNKVGLTPDYSLGKIKQFIEDDEMPAELRVELLKELLYIQNIPLKEHAELHQKYSTTSNKVLEAFASSLEEDNKEEKVEALLEDGKDKDTENT